MPRSLTVLLAVLLSASVAHGADASLYGGTWTFDEAAGDRDRVDAAVDALAGEYGVLFKGMVAKKLGKSVKISTTLMFQPATDALKITSDYSSWTTSLDGAEVAVVDAEGETVLLKRWLDGDTLHSVGAKGTSSQGYTFRLGDDGRTLILQVTTRNPRLKRPLEYSLTYRKE